jgi:dihydroorotase
MATGLSLEQLIEMATINPALVLGEEKRRGSLKTGMPADISIMELTEGDFAYSDGIEGKPFKGNSRLVPVLTLKSGIEIETKPTLK